MSKIEAFMRAWAADVDSGELPKVYPIAIGDTSPNCKPVELNADGTVTLSLSFDHELYAKNNPHEVQENSSTPGTH